MGGPKGQVGKDWRAWREFAPWHEGLAAIVGIVAALRVAYVWLLLPSLGGTSFWFVALRQAREDVICSIIAGIALGCGLHARRSDVLWIRQLAQLTMVVVGILIAIKVTANVPSWEDFVRFWSQPRFFYLLF